MPKPLNEQAKSQSFDGNWPSYFQAVAGRPPRDTLLAALERFETEQPDSKTPRFAVDLGCGEGRDTVELLNRGWRVLSIDSHPEGISRLLSRPDLQHADHLETRLAPFQEASWPDADLVNASFSLPFCPPSFFPIVWDRIVRSLRRGGRFAGQLFGDKDEWATIPKYTHHTRIEVEALLEPFEIERFEEVEQDGQTALGQQKHWHLFHIVARKL
jgi:SAM-dependent methyltransferase